MYLPPGTDEVRQSVHLVLMGLPSPPGGGLSLKNRAQLNPSQSRRVYVMLHNEIRSNFSSHLS